MPTYLAYFGHSNDYFNYRHHELISLKRMTSRQSTSFADHSASYSAAESWLPYQFIDLEDDSHAEAIMERAVFTKAIIQVWGQGSSAEEVLEDANNRFPADQRSDYLNKDKSFCFEVIAYGKKLSSTHQRTLMNSFSPLFKGNEVANMKTPDVIIFVLQLNEHTLSPACTPLTCSVTSSCMHSTPRLFLGRQVAPRVRLCQFLNHRLRLSLSNRPVLGPTTLDNDLAFTMCNFAELKKNELVLDPFCGTCGILITAASLGATVFGSDLDLRVLNGWQCTYSKGGQERKDIMLNFEHYELPKPEILAVDNSGKRVWKKPFVDKVISDTPYGVRACTKKLSGVRDEYLGLLNSPATGKVKLESFTDDALVVALLDLAVDVLVPEGILVFLMHIDLIDLMTPEEIEDLRRKPTPKFYLGVRPIDGREAVYAPETARHPAFLKEDRYRSLIPKRDGLRYVASCIQLLSCGTARLLVKMQRE